MIDKIELLKVELYQLFRDYSGIDIGYNVFCKWLDKQVSVMTKLGERNDKCK